MLYFKEQPQNFIFARVSLRNILKLPQAVFNTFWFGIRKFLGNSFVRVVNRNNNFPFLISFPRTGSHWLRIILEIYTKKPILPRSQLLHLNSHFLLIYDHDFVLSRKPESVIFLYRENPVDVVFSALNYFSQNLTNIRLIDFWTCCYAHHLSYWLNEDVSKKKTIIVYEKLQSDFTGEFRKVCEHLNLDFDPIKLQDAIEKGTKVKISQQNKFDPNVINDTPDYELRRKEFEATMGKRIREIFQKMMDSPHGN